MSSYNYQNFKMLYNLAVEMAEEGNQKARFAVQLLGELPPEPQVQQGSTNKVAADMIEQTCVQITNALSVSTATQVLDILRRAHACGVAAMKALALSNKQS